MLYTYLLKPIFFRFDPEKVHDFMTKTGIVLGNNALTRALVGLIYGYRGPDISKTVDGITYKTPFLLSAGFDYNGELSKILPCVSFGGEEVGSVTAKPCEGNPTPRLTRLPRSRSIMVNKGLRNDGVDAIIERLKRDRLSAEGTDVLSKRPSERAQASENEARLQQKPTPFAEEARQYPRRFVVGVSIARTNCAESVPLQAGIDDYAYSFKRLNEEDVGDYYTINISCPNSFGGEAFTTPDLLNRLLTALSDIPCEKPIYVKMPINLPWDLFNSLLKVVDIHGLNGVIIGNLNKDYGSLAVRSEAPDSYAGGISGQPCRELSTDLIRRTREAYGSRFTIIGVGGVDSPEAAQEKFDAGADLVMLITGMIYRGPGLIKKLCKAYSRRISRA